MRDEALGVCLDVFISEIVLLLHQCRAHLIQRVHCFGIILIVNGLLHKDIELRDLLIILIHLLVIGIQLGLGFRSHNLDGLWVVHVTHKHNVLVVGKERHRAFSAFHLQGIKNLRVVEGCCQHGLVIVDDSRVDDDRFVVNKLLQINGFCIGIGQADIDLKAIGTLVAGGQAKRECNQK